jgi:2-iminobutanoate/2-iminopropanoate deaminase
MTQFLNPVGQPDFRKFGLSLGAATEELVFAAGMAADTENGGRLSGTDTVADETRVCLRMVEAVLAEAGCTLADVVKTTCYLQEDAYRGEFMEAYKEFFAPDRLPARCTFIVGIGGECRVEIDAIAVRSTIRE